MDSNRLASAKWTLFLVLTLLAACARDPMVRRKEYFESGMHYFQKANYPAAAIQFQNAIQSDPRYADAHYQLALTYLKQGMWSGAYQELLRTVDLEPNNAKAQTDLSKLLLAGRRFQEAHDRADTVLAVDPGNADAQMVLANADAALGNIGAGIQESQKAVEMAPDRPETFLSLALLQAKNNQPSDAEKNFLKTIAVNPKFLPGLLAIGEFYLQQRRLADAEKEFGAAISAAPDNPTPRAAMASLFLAEGRKADAEKSLSEAKNALPNNPDAYRMLGDYYLSLGDLDKALTEFASLHQAHPKDLRVKKTYIQLLILQNQVPQAKKLNDEISKASPKDTDALLLAGQILGREGHPADAIPLFQQALKNAPDNAAAHYQLGLAYSMTGSLEQAQSQWRAAVQLQPSFLDAQRALANMALRRGDWDLLAQSADQLIRSEPGAAEGFIFRGTERLARNDLSGAETYLRKALEVAPENSIPYVRLGELRATQNRGDEAQKLFAQALDRDPNSIEALRGLTALFLQHKQPAKAISAVQAQIAKAPNNSSFYFLLGELLFNNKQLDKAEPALQKALELDQNNVDAILLLARLQTEKGSVDQAIASYQRAIQNDPRELRLYIAQGSLEENRGNWQQAEKLYQTALQVQPDYPVAANNLAYLLLEHEGNQDVALSLAQTARRGLPDVPNTADTLAWAYYYKGAYGSAIDLLREAVKSAPNNPTYRYHLGMVYQKSKDTSRAREQLEQALKLNPPQPLATEIRKALADSTGT